MEQQRLRGIFDRAAADYDRVEPRFFAEIARRLVARLDLHAGARVLDVATGPGVVLAAVGATGVPGLTLVGVDLSRGMAAEARSRLAAARTPAGVAMMDAARLGVAGGAFDVVTMSRAYLQPRRDAVLGELLRALRPGGTLAIAEFGRRDVRWDWKDALYAQLLPGTIGGPPRSNLDAVSLRAELLAGGVADARVETDWLDIAFDDLEHWWASSLSHGERGALELLDDHARQRFHRLADTDACREADGRLHWRPEVLYAIGRRPA